MAKIAQFLYNVLVNTVYVHVQYQKTLYCNYS